MKEGVMKAKVHVHKDDFLTQTLTSKMRLLNEKHYLVQVEQISKPFLYWYT